MSLDEIPVMKKEGFKHLKLGNVFGQSIYEGRSGFGGYREKYSHGVSNIKKYTKRALFGAFVVGCVLGYVVNDCQREYQTLKDFSKDVELIK